MQSTGLTGELPQLFEVILLTVLGLMGAPGGSREPQLLTAADPRSVLYCEWTARDTSAPPNASSPIGKFLHDPDIEQFGAEFRAALKMSAHDTAAKDQPRLLKLRLASLLAEAWNTAGSLQVRVAAVDRPAATITDIYKHFVVTVTLFDPDRSAAIADAARHVAEQLNMQRVRTDGVAEARTWQVYVADSFVVLTNDDLSENSLKKSLGRDSGGFSSIPELVSLKDWDKRERLASLAWVDVERLRADLQSLETPPARSLLALIKQLDGGQVHSLLLHSTCSDAGTRLQLTMAVPQQLTGLLRLFDGPPLSDKSIKNASDVSNNFCVASIQLSALLLGFEEVVAIAAPAARESLKKIERQLENDLGFTVKDLDEAFGPEWCAQIPESSNPFGTDSVIWCRLRDANLAKGLVQKFKDAFERLVPRLLGDLNPENATKSKLLQQKTFRNEIMNLPVDTVLRSWRSIISDSEWGALHRWTHPTFCLEAGQFVIAPTAMNMQSYLVRQKEPSKKGLQLTASLPTRNEGILVVVGSLNTSRRTLAAYRYMTIRNAFESSRSNNIRKIELPLPPPPSLAQEILNEDSVMTIHRHEQSIVLQISNSLPLVISRLVDVLPGMIGEDESDD